MDNNQSASKNLFISFIVIFLFIVVWQIFFMKKNAPVNTQEHKAEVSSNTAPQKPMQQQNPGTKSRLEYKNAALVETPLVIAKFNSNGAISRLYLKKYHTDLLDTTYANYISTDTLIYSANPAKLSINDRSDSIVFIANNGNKKVYVFSASSYIIHFYYSGPMSGKVEAEGNLHLDAKNIKEERSQNDVISYTDKLNKVKITKLDKKKFKGSFDDVAYCGIKSKYFLFAILNNPKHIGTYRFDIINNTPYMSVNTSDSLKVFNIYAGPIDYFMLKKLGYKLDKTYDFGMSVIAPFSKALLYILRFIHNFIPNYGWAIIVFAFLMKIVFFPLTFKGLRSMRKMQELKPKIDALNKIHKNDPQRLQKEIMNLYKEHNVNPFSGCLTMIIQLPIFWALYKILRITIDLRHAPFLFWIKDLSVKDPYYILPILMGITSYFQSKLQSGTGDTQSRMMTIFMPIFLVIIFLSLPSGIVLYWFAYNIFSIFEMYLIKRVEVSEK